MERPEIIDGLKNAIDRGYSIEIAVSSFINAGYNRQDVLDSAKFLGGSVLALEPKQRRVPQQPSQISQQQISQQTPPPIQPKNPQSNFSQQFPKQQPQQRFQQPAIVNVTIQNQPQAAKKKDLGMIILLVVILVVLLGVLFTVLFAGDFVRELLARINLEL